jgi:hypothetical protein
MGSAPPSGVSNSWYYAFTRRAKLIQVDGTKTAVLVRILLPEEQDGHQPKALIRVLKLKTWTPDQSKLADTVLTTKLNSVVLESGSKRGDQADSWNCMRGVYTGTAIDDTWRASIGMAGGKPWASRNYA